MLEHLSNAHRSWTPGYFRLAPAWGIKTHATGGCTPRAMRHCWPPSRGIALPLPGAATLREAFFVVRAPQPKPPWSACEATPNQVEPVLVGHKAEVLFDTFDLAELEIRHHGVLSGRRSPSVSNGIPAPRSEQRPRRIPLVRGIAAATRDIW
jgi:hypothetical protein